MVDWDVAINIFLTGVLGVMVVMLLLQITIQLSSFIIRRFEKSDKKEKAES